MRAKKIRHPKHEGRIPDGSRCEIIRPALWAGHRCVVEKFSEESGLHTLLVDGKNGKFHAEAPASCLRVLQKDFKKILGL